MQYNEQTFQWIVSEQANIQQVAQKLGVSVTAIAAAMAKERYEYDNKPAQAALNPIQDFLESTFPFSNAQILDSYQKVINLGLVGAIPSASDRLSYPTLNDYGYAKAVRRNNQRALRRI